MLNTTVDLRPEPIDTSWTHSNIAPANYQPSPITTERSNVSELYIIHIFVKETIIHFFSNSQQRRHPRRDPLYLDYHLFLNTCLIYPRAIYLEHPLPHYLQTIPTIYPL